MGEFRAYRCDSCKDLVDAKEDISGGILIFDDLEELIGLSEEDALLLFKEKKCWQECCSICKQKTRYYIENINRVAGIGEND